MPRRPTQDTISRPPRETPPGDRPRPPTAPLAPAAAVAPPLSKSQRKRDAQALQALGAQLITVSPASLARLDLPEALREAVVAARGLHAHGARTRQVQYIGKLMRQLEPAVLRRVREALVPRRTTTL